MNGQGKRDPQTYAIIGAAMEVHRELGPGFLETVHQEALALESEIRKLPFKREVSLQVSYKSQPLACHFRADFVYFKQVVVETKALSKFTTIEMAQGLNYLKATGCQCALLFNFGAPRLEYQRFVLNYKAFSADDADQRR